MKIFSELKRLVEGLQGYEGTWALCGGVVASIYRQTPRFTADIGVAIIDCADQSAEDMASAVIKKMGYKPIVGFVPNFSGRSGQQKALICGRSEQSERFVGVDFLLPVFPWVSKGVQRAQENKVDYGFARLPTITVEDLLLAKILAINEGERLQDLDDARSILSETLRIDSDYLINEALRIGIVVPDWVKKSLFERST